MNSPDHPPQLTQYISRATLIALLNAGIRSKEYKFTRQAALQWLATYPGDLEASLYYAQGLLGENKPAQAIPILKGLCQADPEFLEAVQTLAGIDQQEDQSKKPQYQPKNYRYPSSNRSPFLEQQNIQNWLLALKGNLSVFERFSGPKIAIDGESGWGQSLWHVRKSISEGQISEAEEEIVAVLATDPHNPLTALTHLQVLRSNPAAPLTAKISLAEHYHRQWPDCLPISLLFASWQIEEGASGKAVALIHQTATRDISGQVPSRLWGTNNPYQSLWPDIQGIRLGIPIPANVATWLGWNQLPSPAAIKSIEEGLAAATVLIGAQSTHEDEAESRREEIPISENLEENELPQVTPELPQQSEEDKIRKIINDQARLAAVLKQPGLENADNRFPIYVILSSRTALRQQYGDNATIRLETEIQRLAAAVQMRRRIGNHGRWGSYIFLPDVESSVSQYGLKPLSAIDPWSLKLALKDLDTAMSKRGEMIGALVIIGGPEIIPFHRLPNPVDDLDLDVASDNPYGSLDENYFIMEWPVGRLPGSGTADVEPLVYFIQQAIKQHTNRSSRKIGLPKQDRKSITSSWWSWLTGWLSPSRLTRRSGYGYTAAIWRNASSAVFRPVNGSGKLFCSPPMGLDGNSQTVNSRNGHNNISLPSAMQGYFNLHGLADSPEWYGQRDPQEPGDDPDYPVALRLEDVRGMERQIPHVVFSEACYGAYLDQKTIDQAMALQFLASGCLAVVGSTCIAYGAINAPLIAADLLGFSFWKLLQDGHNVGEAIRLAKIQLVEEMSKRQGYLDGEDQKTLISFILLGDPLARTATRGKGSKNIVRSNTPANNPKTVCDRIDSSHEDMPPEINAYVKKLVSYYLPGMSDADWTYTTERARCSAEGHTCPTSQFTGKNGNSQHPDRHLVMLAKQVVKAGHIHPQFARLTLDSQGKLVKFVVSR